MKKISLTIALSGLCVGMVSAHHNDKFAENYPVCLRGNTYQICNEQKAQLPQSGYVKHTDGTFGMKIEHLVLGSGNVRYHHNIRVICDQPGAAYKGIESKINDGIRKDEMRNLNTDNGAYVLPPSDGGKIGM
ncbi:MAG: hypothetical protein JSS78_07235 [Bacteroidetes bacterium]|nr:hypothetical protein [Bacteroidota bacterium]